MRAFVISMVVMVAVTAIAALVLDNIDMSAQQIFSSETGSVRL